MRRLLSIIVLTIFCIFCFAQESSHLKFKGIPIDGKLDSFVQKLKNKGYTYVGTKDGMSVLKGEFATTKGCTIGVARFSHRDQVNTVVVMFPEMKTWSTIYNTYLEYKEMLTEKYGEPDCVEEFAEGTSVHDDWFKFHAVLRDECNYVSTFKTDNGNIVLTMMKMDYNTASVVIKYIDKANAEETRRKVMEEL